MPPGPQAWAVLVPFLDDRPDDKPCFSPKEAEAWRYADRPPYSGRERTAKDASETKRLAERKAARREAKRKPGRKCRGQYDRDSDRRAVRRGVEKAKAAEVRKAAGPEAGGGRPRPQERRRDAGLRREEPRRRGGTGEGDGAASRSFAAPPERTADVPTESCPDPAGTPLTGGAGRGRGGRGSGSPRATLARAAGISWGGNPELPGDVIAARCVSPSGFDDEPCPPRRRIGRTFRTTA